MARFRLKIIMAVCAAAAAAAGVVVAGQLTGWFGASGAGDRDRGGEQEAGPGVSETDGSGTDSDLEALLATPSTDQGGEARPASSSTGEANHGSGQQQDEQPIRLRVVIVKGADQKMLTGRPAEEDLVIKVVDADNPNRVVVGVPVTFELKSGGGLFAKSRSGLTTVTNWQGLAGVCFIAGSQAGENEVTAVPRVSADDRFTLLPDFEVVPPQAASEYLTRGTYLWRDGKWDAAMEDFAQTFARDSRDMAAYNNVAWTIANTEGVEREYADEAVRYATIAVSLARSPEERVAYLDTLAHAYHAQGNDALAVEYAEQALQMASEERKSYHERQLEKFGAAQEQD